MAKINSLSIVGAIIVITTFVSSVLAEDGQIFVGTSDQTKFVSTGSSVLAVQPVQAGASFLVGDVNGDGKADIVVFQHGTQAGTGVYVGLSNGSSFAPAQKWNDYFCVVGEECAVGDVNGDGKADIVVFQHGTQTGTGVYVGLSNGSSFAPAKKWNDYFCISTSSPSNPDPNNPSFGFRSEEVCAVGDVNGDGKADIVVFQHGTQTGTGVYVGLSNGSSFAPAQKWNDYFCVSPNVNGTGAERCAVGDVNGDGKADIVVFQHGTQAGTGVYVGRSNGSSFAPAKKWNDYFCVGQQEACAVGDVNGDRQADVIAFRTPPLIGPH
jgi:hypothetical protein